MLHILNDRLNIDRQLKKKKQRRWKQRYSFYSHCKTSECSLPLWCERCVRSFDIKDVYPAIKSKMCTQLWLPANNIWLSYNVGQSQENICLRWKIPPQKHTICLICLSNNCFFKSYFDPSQQYFPQGQGETDYQHPRVFPLLFFLPHTSQVRVRKLGRWRIAQKPCLVAAQLMLAEWGTDADH